MRSMKRLVTAAAVAASATAALTLTSTTTASAAPAVHAVGESSKCTVNFPDFGATVGKNGWNFRTGPSTGYISRGLLYRGDKLTVMCSRNNWVYAQLSRRSASGLPAGARGWVRQDGLLELAG